MGVEVITTEDLADFRLQLLKDIENLLDIKKNKKWLKTSEVLELLDMSDVTLQTLRNKGIIPFRKLGGICYYNADELDEALKNL
jgi:hypothetical protein